MTACNTIYYDQEFVRSIKDSSMIWWRMSYVYRSLWRNLHVDNFEGYIFSAPWPPRTGRLLKLFQYEDEGT